MGFVSGLKISILGETMAVKDVFNQYASEYDTARRRLIPCFDDLYQTLVDIVPFNKDQKLTVLDLGAGTGLVSATLAASYSNAHFVLVDVAEKMLDQAQKRLTCFDNRFDFSTLNYAHSEISGEYDLVVSGLSIHHLDNRQKEWLFKEIYGHLTPGGMFINVDQVLGETPEIDELYRSNWLSAIRELGCSEVEIDAAFERMREDKMSTISHQLGALSDAQFEQVNCWYKKYSFVVYSGKKQAA